VTFLEDVKKKYPVYAPFLDTIRADSLLKGRYSTAAILRKMNSGELQVKNYDMFSMLKKINEKLCEDVLQALNSFSEALANQQDIHMNFVDDFLLGGIGIYIADVGTGKECYNVMRNELDKNIKRIMTLNIPYPDNDMISSRTRYDSSTYPVKTYFYIPNGMVTKHGNEASNTIYVPFHQIVWY